MNRRPNKESHSRRSFGLPNTLPRKRDRPLRRKGSIEGFNLKKTLAGRHPP
jgi:hypothetical protein